MKLLKCKACGHEVSKKAEKCPSCGQPVKRKSVGCFGALVVIALAIGFAAVVVDKQEAAKPQRPLTAEEQRAEKIRDQFSPWNGSHYELERIVKRALKDPDSYEHIETRFSDRGANGIYVVMKYRAKNSFGGYVIEGVTATFDIEGKLLEGPARLE